MTSVLLRDRREDMDTKGKARGRRKAELKMMCFQNDKRAKKCLEPPEAGRGKGGTSPRACGGRAGLLTP